MPLAELAGLPGAQEGPRNGSSDEQVNDRVLAAETDGQPRRPDVRIVAVVRRNGAVVGKKRLPIMTRHLTTMHTCWISGKVPAAGGNKDLRIAFAFAFAFGGNDKMGPSDVSGKVAPRVPPVGS